MLKRYFSKTNLCWIALSAIAFILVSVLINIGLLGSYYQITLYNICINIILAVSLNLIIGICGQFSLGHAGFMCIGAYSAAILVKSMPNMGGFAIGIVIGLVISAIAALIVSIPTLRLRGDYLAIATLGFSEIIRIIVLNMEITNGAAGITGIPQLTSWPLLFIVMVLSIIIVTNFGRSRQGRACICQRVRHKRGCLRDIIRSLMSPVPCKREVNILNGTVALHRAVKKSLVRAARIPVIAAVAHIPVGCRCSVI